MADAIIALTANLAMKAVKCRWPAPSEKYINRIEFNHNWFDATSRACGRRHETEGRCRWSNAHRVQASPAPAPCTPFQGHPLTPRRTMPARRTAPRTSLPPLRG